MRKIQEIFSQFEYKQPENPEYIMIDFYFMIGYVANVEFDDEQVDWTMNYAVKQCVYAHCKHMIKALKYCCAAEFKHITEYCEVIKKAARMDDIVKARKILKKHYSPLTHRFLLKFLPILGTFTNDKVFNVFNPEFDMKRRDMKYPVTKDTTRYLSQYKAVVLAQKELGYSDMDLAQVFIEMFADDEGWHGSYGGKAWQSIARCMLDLLKAKSQFETGTKMFANTDYKSFKGGKEEGFSQMVTYCDHAYDLEHNTGVVFNKLESYAQEGSYSWIKSDLDWKRDNKNLKDFYDKVSPQLQPVVAYVSKFKYDSAMLGRDAEIINKIKTEVQNKPIGGGDTEEHEWLPVTDKNAHVGMKVKYSPELKNKHPDLDFNKIGVITKVNMSSKAPLLVLWKHQDYPSYSITPIMTMGGSVSVFIYDATEGMNSDNKVEGKEDGKEVDITNVKVGDLITLNIASLALIMKVDPLSTWEVTQVFPETNSISCLHMLAGTMSVALTDSDGGHYFKYVGASKNNEDGLKVGDRVQINPDLAVNSTLDEVVTLNMLKYAGKIGVIDYLNQTASGIKHYYLTGDAQYYWTDKSIKKFNGGEKEKRKDNTKPADPIVNINELNIGDKIKLNSDLLYDSLAPYQGKEAHIAGINKYLDSVSIDIDFGEYSWHPDSFTVIESTPYSFTEDSVQVGNEYSYKLNNGNVVIGVVTEIKKKNEGTSNYYVDVSFTVHLSSGYSYGGKPSVIHNHMNTFLCYLNVGRITPT